MVQVALTEPVFDAEHELSVTRAPVLSDDHQDAGYRQQVPVRMIWEWHTTGSLHFNIESEFYIYDQ